MTFQASALINYVYCVVARSRLTDVATAESEEWKTLNSGDTPVANSSEAVSLAAHTAT